MNPNYEATRKIVFSKIEVREKCKETLYQDCNKNVSEAYAKVQAAIIRLNKGSAKWYSIGMKDKARYIEIALRNAEYAAINEKFATVDAFLDYKPANDSKAMSLREALNINRNRLFKRETTKALASVIAKTTVKR